MQRRIWILTEDHNCLQLEHLENYIQDKVLTL